MNLGEKMNEFRGIINSNILDKSIDELKERKRMHFGMEGQPNMKKANEYIDLAINEIKKAKEDCGVSMI